MRHTSNHRHRRRLTRSPRRQPRGTTLNHQLHRTTPNIQVKRQRQERHRNRFPNMLQFDENEHLRVLGVTLGLLEITQVLRSSLPSLAASTCHGNYDITTSYPGAESSFFSAFRPGPGTLACSLCGLATFRSSGTQVVTSTKPVTSAIGNNRCFLPYGEDAFP